MSDPSKSARMRSIARSWGRASLTVGGALIALLPSTPVFAAVANAHCVLGVGGFADTGPIEFLGSGLVDGVPVSWIAPPPFSVVSQVDASAATQHASVALDVATSVAPAPGDPAVALNGSCSTDADLSAGSLRLQTSSEQVDLTSGGGGQPFGATLSAGFAELSESFDLRVAPDYAGPIEVTLTMTLDGVLDAPARDGWRTGVRTHLHLSNVDDGTPVGATWVSTEEIETSVTGQTVSITAPIRGLVCGPALGCETYFGVYAAVELYGRHPELGDRTFVGSGTHLEFHPIQIALTSPEGVTLQRVVDGGSYAWVNPVPEPSPGLSVATLVGLGAKVARRRARATRARRERLASGSSSGP